MGSSDATRVYGSALGVHARKGRRGARAIGIGLNNELVSGIGQGAGKVRDQGGDVDDDDELEGARCVSGQQRCARGV